MTDTVKLEPCNKCGQSEYYKVTPEGKVLCAICNTDPATRPAPKDGVLAMTTELLRESTARTNSMDEKLYPLREVARVADLVWRGAKKCDTDEEHYYRISPVDMEWLATALSKVTFCLPDASVAKLKSATPAPDRDAVRALKAVYDAAEALLKEAREGCVTELEFQAILKPSGKALQTAVIDARMQALTPSHPSAGRDEV